jgi:MoCo/4Fe-4S cofactor protein with predicted Tat translocation signal
MPPVEAMRDEAPLDLDALRARLATEDGSRLWRSLEELADAPEVRRYVEAEFPDIVQASSIDRRTLLRLMSASLALGGLAACNGSEAAKSAPLMSQSSNMPGYTPGVPLIVATSLPLSGYGRGVLVKTQEGRPIKIDGNPLHPASLGATDVFAQAEVLSLYDPDRSDAPRQNGSERTWEELTSFIRPVRSELVVAEGQGLHILTPPTSSPTLQRLVAQARQLFPHAQWHGFSPIDDDNRRAAARTVFGRDLGASALCGRFPGPSADKGSRAAASLCGRDSAEPCRGSRGRAHSTPAEGLRSLRSGAGGRSRRSPRPDLRTASLYRETRG